MTLLGWHMGIIVILLGDAVSLSIEKKKTNLAGQDSQTGQNQFVIHFHSLLALNHLFYHIHSDQNLFFYLHWDQKVLSSLHFMVQTLYQPNLDRCWQCRLIDWEVRFKLNWHWKLNNHGGQFKAHYFGWDTSFEEFSLGCWDINIIWRVTLGSLRSALL